MNIRENDTNNILYVILDEELRITYFNKFNKHIVESILNELNIHNFIKKNDKDCNINKQKNFKINKCTLSHNYIFIIEIPIHNKIIKNNIFSSDDKVKYMKKFKSNTREYLNIKNEMENLKDKLNSLMKNNYKENYDKVLEVSMQLDNVINEYCMLEGVNINGGIHN